MALDVVVEAAVACKQELERRCAVLEAAESALPEAEGAIAKAIEGKMRDSPVSSAGSHALDRALHRNGGRKTPLGPGRHGMLSDLSWVAPMKVLSCLGMLRKRRE